VGHSLNVLHNNSRVIAAQLSDAWGDMLKGRQPPDEKLAFLWTAHNNARNLMMLGDPAVRALGRGG
jgi:hypothetical protein